MVKSKDLTFLEERIGYVFKNKKLIKTALSHSSYVNESNSTRVVDNERLEFLGDAVLELIISEYIYENNLTLEEYLEAIGDEAIGDGSHWGRSFWHF